MQFSHSRSHNSLDAWSPTNHNGGPGLHIQNWFAFLAIKQSILGGRAKRRVLELIRFSGSVTFWALVGLCFEGEGRFVFSVVMKKLCELLFWNCSKSHKNARKVKKQKQKKNSNVFFFDLVETSQWFPFVNSWMFCGIKEQISLSRTPSLFLYKTKDNVTMQCDHKKEWSSEMLFWSCCWIAILLCVYFLALWWGLRKTRPVQMPKAFLCTCHQKLSKQHLNGWPLKQKMWFGLIDLLLLRWELDRFCRLLMSDLFSHITIPNQ